MAIVTQQTPNNGKTCKIMKLVKGPRGGQYWKKIHEQAATGTIEIDLEPGRYKLTVQKNCRLQSTEFMVK